jgi:hypothetical protein
MMLKATWTSSPVYEQYFQLISAGYFHLKLLFMLTCGVLCIHRWRTIDQW